MAVRQYIGARYVPKFFENPDGSNNWISGITYEPLTIVSYAGLQFISKKPVPASVSTPNENNEYWILNGGSDLSQDILDQINYNTVEINSIKKEKFLLISDSYNNIVSSENKSMFDYAVENIGLEEDRYQILGIGGCGFGSTENNFTNALKNNEINITPDSILVFAGANDFNETEQQILNGIERFSDYCFTRWGKSVNIYIGALSKLLPEYDKNKKVVSAYQKCERFKCSYLWNTEYIMTRHGMFDSGLIHPVPNAVREIGDFITPFIKNKKGDVNRHLLVTLNNQSNVWNFNANNLELIQYNNSVWVQGKGSYGYIGDFTYKPDVQKRYSLECAFNVDDFIGIFNNKATRVLSGCNGYSHLENTFYSSIGTISINTTKNITLTSIGYNINNAEGVMIEEVNSYNVM